MKKVLGLDLGTTSIGWAMVNQAESPSEQSSIIRAGVRVIPLSVEEKDSFEKGKAITTNADRTLKRGMRRNLQRYKLRRAHLLEVLKREEWIDETTILSEEGPGSTFETFRLRALAPIQELSLVQLARVLMMLNRKRGYKSNRKTDMQEEGSLVDGMEVAKVLYEERLTPAEYSLRLLHNGQRILPEYYISDLQAELNRIWTMQQSYYPDMLTDDFKAQLARQGRNGVSKIFLGRYGIFAADNKGKGKKLQALTWRVAALRQQVEPAVLAYVIADIKGEIQNGSGYLGAISDRSKELFFKRQTVGQYLYEHLQKDPHYSTRNQVFYRQDYLDEFEAIWECQRTYHPELTEELKQEIRDVVIFYQRHLKSQKGLISFCEFEQRKVRVKDAHGKDKIAIHGCRVAPRSSLLFQEFKVWSSINHIVVSDRESGDTFGLNGEQRRRLFEELTIHRKMSSSEILKCLGYSIRIYSLNFKEIDGNATQSALYGKCFEIIEASGNGEFDIAKLSYHDARQIIQEVFPALGFRTDFLDFDADLPKTEYEQQPIFKLWHLLYSYEGDGSVTGRESLLGKISELCGMPREYAKILAGIVFKEDYASLSHKAIRKILPYLREGHTYDVACTYAGYNHSHSMTKEEQETRVLADKLAILPKGALRNPVVEKILNQMINVVNALSDVYGKPDEVHIEMARELKQSAQERERAAHDIAERTRANEAIVKIIQSEFNRSYVSKNDILRYRLYEELKTNGYKTLYSNQYVPRSAIFSPEIDIEHIIPQALLFDDSFSNKTLEYRAVNLDKDRDTAADYVLRKYGEAGWQEYWQRVQDLSERGAISKTKGRHLLMKREEIPSDFVNRDLTNTQYIARKAREILETFVRQVVTTGGAITARLREDWQLVDVMKELNLPKYQKAGLVYTVEREDGSRLIRMDAWSKRNDHRHHAMDALTVAFTRLSHIQLLNNLNAASERSSIFYAMKQKETVVINGKRLFVPPMPLGELRKAFKAALEDIYVSIKAKNKVGTHNTNRYRTKNGYATKVQLTPRGELHKESVYGRRKCYEFYEVPVNGKLGMEQIDAVVRKDEREALRRRLEAFGADPKKAFTGKNALDKNPIYLDDARIMVLPDRVRCRRIKTVFTIRKEVSPDLNVAKVMDGKVRCLLEDRFAAFGGDPRKAFSNLDEHPIWFNEEKGIAIKNVTIAENFDLEAIRSKRDKDGRLILDEHGHEIPSDYVNLRNNHHVAIYQDGNGNFQECVVSFFEALNRLTAGSPVVDKQYRKSEGWTFVFSMKINEMFVFPNPQTGFAPDEIDLTDPKHASAISQNLFRVQKLSSKDYWFRHHLETAITENKSLQNVTWRRVTSLNHLKGAVKVRVNAIGQIVAVGEYD